MIRGNNKQRVFLDEQDYGYYLANLKKYKRKGGFLLYAFCLMPNHVHLIGEPKLKEALPKFMQGLSRSYTAYFNKKYKRVGHLWQNRFKSKVVIKDDYLIGCLQYIELNPVRAKLVKAAADYQWSSYKERVLSNKIGTNLLDNLHII